MGDDMTSGQEVVTKDEVRKHECGPELEIFKHAECLDGWDTGKQEFDGNQVDLKGERVRALAGDNARYFSESKGEHVQTCTLENGAIVGVPMSRLGKPRSRLIAGTTAAFRRGFDAIFRRKN